MISRTSRAAIGALAIFATGMTAAPAFAQDSGAEARIRKLEAEVRALQRQVFPGGDGRFFEPQIATGTQPRPTVTTPSTTAVTDILARLDALETQIATLTAQTEQNGNAIARFETRLAALEGGGSASIAATLPAPAATTTGSSTTPTPTSTQLPATSGNLAAMGASRPAATPAAAGPSAQRLAAVQAIAKPQTGDAGDDEYSYGFRLWEAGFYPEAQQQLGLFVDRYASHSRISFGRNLLGRAYLDDGKPREAAAWFLRNYQSDKAGARAPDSLLYLAEAMIASNDTNRACIALAEFGETYQALATGRLASQYEATRRKVTCN
jgi:TolA-binding protein